MCKKYINRCKYIKKKNIIYAYNIMYNLWYVQYLIQLSVALSWVSQAVCGTALQTMKDKRPSLRWCCVTFCCWFQKWIVVNYSEWAYGNCMNLYNQHEFRTTFTHISLLCLWINLPKKKNNLPKPGFNLTKPPFMVKIIWGHSNLGRFLMFFVPF